jgi:phage I-like protein
VKNGLITLSDLPELKGTDPKPRATIVIGRLDDNLRDPRYGKFSIGQSDVDSWKRNLAGVFGGQVSMDFDHSSDRGGGTKAALWINDIGQAGTGNGSLITADVQFSKAGAKAVRNGEYKYTSPTFVANYTDEHGVKHGRALIGGALTNRPVLRKGMPTLSLSRDEFSGVATVSGSRRERVRARDEVTRILGGGKSAAPLDSRGQMEIKTSEMAKLLGLDAGTDEKTLLDTIGELKASQTRPEADDPAEPKTLSKKEAKQARKAAKALARENEDGTVSLSAEGYAEILSKANLGQAAALQLREQTFTTAWTKALSEGRAAPSQENELKALYLENPELAVKVLDGFVPIVPVKPTGSGEDAGTDGPAPLGMDDDRYALHTEAKQLAAQKISQAPSLDPAEAYILAVQEIEDRKFTLEHPGI